MITETVLEMHYHQPLMYAFQSTLGLGKTGSINFYKYSQQKECFVGFDQAYAKSELSDDEFFNQLQAAAASGYSLGDQFIGYFLQFKVVYEMAKRSRYTPGSITSKSHFRVSLETAKNLRTGVSQHELLYNLNKNVGALVYYACPMLFDRSELYEIDVDLNRLRLADLDTCPSDYSDNDSHFIYFDDPKAQPIWCSEPVEGRATPPDEFFSEMLRPRALPERRSESARELLNALTNVEAAGLESEQATIQDMRRPSLLPYIGDWLTVIKITRNESQETATRYGA